MNLSDLVNKSRKVRLEINENKSKVFAINYEKNFILKENDVTLKIVKGFS